MNGKNETSIYKAPTVCRALDPGTEREEPSRGSGTWGSSAFLPVAAAQDSGTAAGRAGLSADGLGARLTRGSSSLNPARAAWRLAPRDPQGSHALSFSGVALEDGILGTLGRAKKSGEWHLSLCKESLRSQIG